MASHTKVSHNNDYIYKKKYVLNDSEIKINISVIKFALNK